MRKDGYFEDPPQQKRLFVPRGYTSAKKYSSPGSSGAGRSCACAELDGGRTQRVP